MSRADGTKYSDEENSQNINEKRQKSRRKYFKPTRIEACRLIKKLIVEDGYTPLEAMEKLHWIPQRTFNRYLHGAFAEERQTLLRSITTEEILDHVAIFEKRLSKDRRDLMTAIQDPNMDPRRLSAMADAYHLASELAVGILKIRHELVPGIFSDHHALTIEELLEIQTETGKKMSLAGYIEVHRKKQLQQQQRQQQQKALEA